MHQTNRSDIFGDWCAFILLIYEYFEALEVRRRVFFDDALSRCLLAYSYKIMNYESDKKNCHARQSGHISSTPFSQERREFN